MIRYLPETSGVLTPLVTSELVAPPAATLPLGTPLNGVSAAFGADVPVRAAGCTVSPAPTRGTGAGVHGPSAAHTGADPKHNAAITKYRIDRPSEFPT